MLEPTRPPTTLEVPEDPPAPLQTDLNLLFGVLALQLGMITQRRFAEACAVWAVSRERSMGDLLVEEGALRPSQRWQLDHLVDRAIREQRHEHATTPGGERPRASTPASDPTEAPEPGRPSHGEPPVLVETLLPETVQRSRYALSRLFAEGGLGRVWKAHDTDLQREVALKELRPEQGRNPDACRRFLREARVTGQLEHPNIVPVYELARRPEDGQPFYTMKLVRGRTLREAIASHRDRLARSKADALERVRLLQAFIAVCHAVGYAHSRGVIHRDLKPDNVALGSFGEVILLDWGLAKILARPEDDEILPAVAVGEDAITGATLGQVGTPAYMAPEQAEARHDLVDERADVHGLGAILFEILTGKPPHTGGSTGEILARIIQGPTPRPIEVDPQVPPPLDAICARAMARERKDRYASASDVADEVQRWLADEPVLAHRETSTRRMARWFRHHRSTLTLIAALAAATYSLTITGLGFRVFQLEQSNVALLRKQLEQDTDIDRMRQYYTLYNEARAERVERTPGWTSSAPNKLATAAMRLGDSGSRRPLRDEMVAGLVTLDADREAALPLAVVTDARHDGYTIAVSPDSRMLAVFCQVHAPRPRIEGGLIDLTSGDVVRRFEEPILAAELRGLVERRRERVVGLAFSPDGQWLAIGMASGLLHLWKVNRADEPSRTWRAHRGAIAGLVFTPDSRALVTSSRAPDHAVARWTVPPPAGGPPVPAARFEAGEWVSAPVSTHEGRHILVTTEQGLRRLDLDDLQGPVIADFPFDDFLVSPRGGELVAHDTRILVRSLGGGPTHAITEPGGFAHRTRFDLRYNRDGALLVSWCDGQSESGIGRNIKLWDTASHRLITTIHVPGSEAFQASFTPDGTRLVYVTNRQVYVRRIHGLEVLSSEAHTPSPGRAAAWSADGTALLVMAGEPNLAETVAPTENARLVAMRWDLANPERSRSRTRELPGQRGDVFRGGSITETGRGGTVAITTFGKLHLWNPGRDGSDAGTETWQTLDLPAGWARVGPARGGGLLWGRLTDAEGPDQLFTISATGMGFRTVLDDRPAVNALTMGASGFTALAVAGGRVALGTMTGHFQILADDRPGDSPLARDRISPSDAIRSLALSANGAWLALGTASGRVIVRETRPDGPRSHEIDKPNRGRVGAVALSSDGGLVACGNDDHTVRLHHNTENGLVEIFRLPPLSDAIGDLAFSPDGARLLIRVENEYAVRVLHLHRLRPTLEAAGLGW